VMGWGAVTEVLVGVAGGLSTPADRPLAFVLPAWPCMVPRWLAPGRFRFITGNVADRNGRRGNDS
jgi:hypothetical protein